MVRFTSGVQSNTIRFLGKTGFFGLPEVPGSTAFWDRARNAMAPLPNIVIVVDESTLDRLPLDPQGAALLNRPDLALVPVHPDTPTELTVRLEELGLLRAGIRAVQSPFDPTNYAEVSTANDRFALEKHFALTALCAHLGASLVKIDQIEIKTSKGLDKIDVSSGTPGGLEAQARYNKELAANLDGRLKLVDRFAGGPPDLESARKLLQAKRLVGDPNLWSLYEARSSTNKLLSRSLSMSLTDINTSAIEAAAQLQVPGYVRFKISYTSTFTYNAQYRLNYYIEFPCSPEPG